MNLEETVRATVHDLADDAPPMLDLADSARARGRRLRRQRRAGLAAGLIALAAVTVTPYLVLRPDDAPTAPLQQAPPPPQQRTDWWTAPYQLPGGVIVTALSRRDVGSEAPGGRTVRDGNVLLNRTTGEYTVLPASYYTIYGAPAGERAVALNGEGGSGIVDASGGRGVWQDVSFEPDWSADGARILFDIDGGYSVMDAATGKVRQHLTPDAVYLCPDTCWFSWLPGGREVAVPQRDVEITRAENKPDTIKYIAIYETDTGKRVRLAPVPGVPVRQDAWAPDATKVLVRNQKSASGGPTRVLDMRTGRTLATIPGNDVHFLPNGKILALADGVARLYDVQGRLLQAQQLPADFDDRAISIGTAQ